MSTTFPELVQRLDQSLAVLRGMPTSTELEVERLQTSVRQLRSAYAGAVFNRLNSDWIVAPLPSDQQLVTDLKVLRTRARDLVRNNPFATRYQQLVEDNVVGPVGIGWRGQMRSATGDLDGGRNRHMRDTWLDWGDSVTRDGRMGIVETCLLAADTWAQDGEVFIRKHVGRQYPMGLALEFIDADLIDESFNIPRDPMRSMDEVRLSIQVDENARPVGYWCYEEPYFYGMSGRKRYWVPASEMIHIGRHQRINQTRFVPWYHPVMDAMRMLDGLAEAELVASRASAAKMGWLISKDSDTPGGKNPDGTRNPIPMEASPGSIAMAPPGWEFQAWDPQHPTTAFGTFHASMVRRIAAGLGISYTSLANDPGDANYSSSRTALQQEQRFWRKIQQSFIRQFLQSVLDSWIGTAYLTGDLDIQPELYRQARRVKWEPPGWEWIDPKNDVEAAVLAIQNNLDSEQRVLGARGLDFEDDIIAPRKAAKQLIDDAGLAPAVAAAPAPVPVPGVGPLPNADTPAQPESGSSASDGEGQAPPSKRTRKPKSTSAAAA